MLIYAVYITQLQMWEVLHLQVGNETKVHKAFVIDRSSFMYGVLL